MILLAASIDITDQGIIGYTVAIIMGFGAILGLCVTILAMLAKLGERVTRIETINEIYVNSQLVNKRGVVVTDNPLTKHEQDILDYVLSPQGVDAGWDELEIAARACVREGNDEGNSRETRNIYLGILPALDTRKGLIRYEEWRRQLPWTKRFLNDLGILKLHYGGG